MKKINLLQITLLILPWLTVPFLGRSSFKKYVPSAIFICTVTAALDLFGERKKWWRFYKGMSYVKSMNFFNWGPYFVSSFWMLKMTYGKFPLYIISNTILHICFIYLGGLTLLNRYKIASLVKLTKFQYLVIDFIRAIMLYGFQCITNNTKKLSNE